MKIRNTALYLFFLSSLVTIIGIVAKSDLLLLITRPIVIPSIFFYYISSTRRPNWIFILFLAFNFIGDSIVMVRFDNFLYTMVPFFITYLLIMKVVLEDISFRQLHYTKLGFSFAVLALLLFILSLLIDLQKEDGQTLVIPIIIYGIVLAFLSALSVYNYLTNKTISGFYLLIACGCALLSDVFFVLYHLHFHLLVLNVVNGISQLLSYFFFTKYMTNRKKIQFEK